MAFIHYLSPGVRPGHVGESLRTRDVRDAWTRVRRFLAEHTDDPSPTSVMLRVDKAVDDDGAVAQSIAEKTEEALGAGTLSKSSDGLEHGWEWGVAASELARVVDVCEQHAMRPRIHTTEAVRRHGSPKTPQVWASIAYLIAMRCGREDTHVFRPGWGQSQLRAYLGYNEVWLALHLPFDHFGAEFESTVEALEASLGHKLSDKRWKLHH